MKVTTLRGVCIGIDQHLKAGDTADLDPATGKYLVSIGAVEEIVDAPPQPESPPESEAEKQPEPEVQPEPAPDKESESKSKQKK